MKKFLSILVFAVSASCASSVQAQSTFRDVPDNHWAAAAVKRLAEAGIIIGRPANEARTSQASSGARLAAMVPAGAKVGKEAPAWGKVVNGLQAGINANFSSRVYKSGDIAHFIFSIRNVSKKDVKLEETVGNDIVAQVVYKSGKSLPLEAQVGLMNLDSGRGLVSLGAQHIVLKPGAQIDWPSWYQLDIGKSQPNSHHPLLAVAPGDYQISLTQNFGDEENKTWQGLLQTGPLALTIAK
jgi:hypothetical protein